MSRITLIRHGQAQTHANDEAGYDRLSDLGHRQAGWLGAHLRETGQEFARVYTGTQLRHRQTAAAMGAGHWGDIRADERLNEVAYFDLSQRMHAQFGIPQPTCREEFITHLPLVFSAWQEGRIEGAPESFHDFQARVDAVLAEVAAGEGRALVVTSGGLIGMAVRVAMGLELGAYARLCLSILNTSLHQLHPIGAGLTLTQFNAIPHLEARDRQAARTYV